MKYDMNKKYINLGIIGLMIVILVIAGFMDYKKGIDKDIENIDLQDTSETVDNSVAPVENIDPSVTTTTPNPTSVAIDFADPKRDKFNQAIIDGDKSFLSKDYPQAIIQYNKALSYVNSQIAYTRLFTTYNVIGDVNKAIEAIDKAIALKPSVVDYWNTKIQYLDGKTTASFAELKAIYTQGLSKVDPKSKIDLITNFARIAENNGEKAEAIALWNKAIEVYPQNKTIYQAEIDRLSK